VLDLTNVIYEKRGHVAYVTLNRPGVLNALDSRTHTELGMVWDEFERDDSVWVGVLTGAGRRSFSTGQDLKELAVRTRNGAQPSSLGSNGGPGAPRLTERFNLSKPLIARVNGFALGGGFELALSCDIIVAAEQALFAFPEARLGLIPGAGGALRLPRQMGSRTAMGYLLTGRRMSARRAFELGLVNEVVDLEDLDAAVTAWVDDLLACAPLAVRAIKEIATHATNRALQEAFSEDYHWERLRRLSSDTREGPLAFVEKRPPRWEGR
jgi:dehydration protein DpgD